MRFNSKGFKLSRHTQWGILFFFLVVILAARLAFLQLVQGEQYKERAKRQVIKSIPLKAPRGIIFDRNGEVLAGNREIYNVDIFYSELIKGDANNNILKVVEILERYGANYSYDLPLKAVYNYDTGTTDLVFNFDDTPESSRDAEMERWFKLYGFSSDITPYEALDRLIKRFDVSEDYDIHQKLKILSVWNKIRKSGFRTYLPVTIARDIDKFTLAVLAEYAVDMPGIVITPSYIRHYPNENLACHVLGYMGIITAEDLEANREYYEKNNYDPVTDLVGRWEMEYVLEPYLHGTDGYVSMEVDAYGRGIRFLERVEPVPGDNAYLTLDLRLQRVADKALTEAMEKIRSGYYGKQYKNAQIGSVVVLDVNTGEVLALVNKPDYDPNFSVTGQIPPEVWKELNPSYPDPRNPERESLDPTLPRPLVNNAVRGIYPPGSIFKMVVGIAGLEEGAVSPSDIIFDQGRYQKYTKVNSPSCWIWNMFGATHGQVDIVSALRDSCNYYFYELADRIGIEAVEEYSRRFGLGVRTGIELPYEAQGIIAGPGYTNVYIQQIVRNRLINLKSATNSKITDEIYEKINGAARSFVENTDLDFMEERLKEIGITLDRGDVYKIYSYIRDSKWNPAKTSSASIGQAENTFTPLQMANYTAVLANGGTRYKCYLTERIVSPNGEIIIENQPVVTEKIEMAKENYEAITFGMRAVTTSIYKNIPGTAAKYFTGCPVEVAGKTGSAQFPGRDSYGWFVGYAPYDKPEIAVAVMVGQAGSGGYVVPVAREIFEEYFRIKQKTIISIEKNSPTR